MANLNDIDKRADLDIFGYLSCAAMKYQLAEKAIPKRLQKKLNASIEKSKRYVPKGCKLMVCFTRLAVSDNVNENPLIPHVDIVPEDTDPNEVMRKYIDDWDDDEDEDEEDE